jgi:hypothetical protein
MPQRDAIERRAYELYEARGREDGHDWEDWLKAERELERVGVAARDTANESPALRRKRADRAGHSVTTMR